MATIMRAFEFSLYKAQTHASTHQLDSVYWNNGSGGHVDQQHLAGVCASCIVV